MADIIEPLNHRPQIRWKKPVILLALVLFGLYASTHMVAAGDTWVALACGRHFANHGVDTVEPFSFNSHPPGPTDEQLAGWPEWTHRLIRFWHPTGWINQNWLTHLTFYKLVTGFGSEQEPHYNALVYWKFALFVATIFVVYALGKVLGAGDFLSMLAACFAMVAGRSFYDIRPACYSNLLVPLFILLLALSCYRHYKYIWLMVPLIVFWANVHGGYIYAYIMMTPFVAVHILLNLPRRWTIALGLSGLWMVLYLLFYKFHQNSYYFELAKTLNLSFDRIGFVNGFFWTGIVLSVVSLTLAALRRIPSGLFYSFHVVATLVYPVGLLAAMTLNVPSYVSPAYLKLLKHSMTVGRLGFVLVLLLGTVIVILLAIRKERFVRIPNKTIAHILGAGVVSFLAMIVFNPYHLTNLTHTFEISISEHAASWRTVNEWRPAFDWMDPARETPNPVGDEEGFAVMLIAAVVLLAVWGGVAFLQTRTASDTQRPASSRGRAGCRCRLAQNRLGDTAYRGTDDDYGVSVASFYRPGQSIRFTDDRFAGRPHLANGNGAAKLEKDTASGTIGLSRSMAQAGLAGDGRRGGGAGSLLGPDILSCVYCSVAAG